MRIKSRPISLGQVQYHIRSGTWGTHDMGLTSVLGQPISSVRVALEVASGYFVLIRGGRNILENSDGSN